MDSTGLYELINFLRRVSCFFAKMGSATSMTVLCQRDQTSKEHTLLNSGGALQTTSSILKPKVLV